MFEDVLDMIEALYYTEYDSEEVEESTGSEVEDFLNWCRANCAIKVVNGED